MGRISWTDELSRELLVILTDEKDKGVSKHNWANIAKKFNAQTALSALRKQVQNHYADLKEKFKCWEELQRMTGISYNPVTNEMDVEERSLPRWQAFLERNSRYGHALAKKELANVDLLGKLFSGQTAHGVGGCFSLAMGKKTTYSTKSKEGNLVDINEGHGDTEDDEQDEGDVVPNLSFAESISPPKTMMPKAKANTNSKHKSEDTIDSVELKRRHTSFDSVIHLLTNAIISSSTGPTKAEKVRDELVKMGVHEIRGDAYFSSAVQYLVSEDRFADTFLAMMNDNQRWHILDKAPIDD